MSKQAKTTTHEGIEQGIWTKAVGKVREHAIDIWNAVSPHAISKDFEYRMEHGMDKDFKGANADDLAVIRPRDIYLGQVLFHGTPYLTSYDQALAAWLAGLFKCLAKPDDTEKYSRVSIKPSEIKAIMTSNQESKNKALQRETVVAFLCACGFDPSVDELGYTQWTLKGYAGKNAGKRQTVRNTVRKALNALEAAEPFPVSILRPSKDEAAKVEKRDSKSGRNAPIDLVVSCGCTVKEARKTAKLDMLRKLPPVQGNLLIGTPCPQCGYKDKKKTAINPDGGRYVKATKTVLAKLAKQAEQAKANAKKNASKPKAKRAA